MLAERLDPATRRSPVKWTFFRFFALYFFLYVATSRMLGALVRVPVWYGHALSAVLDPLVRFAGAHIFHVAVSSTLTGSGDRMYDWVQVFCLMAVAVACCALWWVLERMGAHDDRLCRWFRVFVGFALGATLIAYGFEKVFPFQMQAPNLTRLLEPYGNFSLMGVLWSAVGASFPYERFAGLVEVIGGGLLFFPRTELAGALVCLLATVEVFVLNMTYDVSVKLFSLHLVLMSVVLVAPHAKRIGRAVLITTSRSRWATFAQAAFGLYLLGMAGYQASQVYAKHGAPAATPALYGVWGIDRMSIDGVERLPLVTDYERWHRVIVQDTATMVFGRMDDTFLVLDAKLNSDGKTISLSRGAAPAGSLTFQQPSPSRLILDGRIDKHALHMEMQLVDHRKFQLLSRGFHWVQEAGVNR